MNLSTQYPLWFIIFCLLLGALYAYVLYYKNQNSGFGIRLRYALALFRMITVSVIAFLLLNPLIRYTSQFTEKPVIVIGLDNSASIRTMSDSIYFLNDYSASLQKLADDLSVRFDVRIYTFGENVRPGLNLDFSDSQTDISGFLDEVKNVYSYRNTGAMIVASDGLYNRGSNPVYAAQGLNMPVYTIALGDTTIHRDVLIKRVNYNRVSFVGNDFPVEIVVEAKKSYGLSTRLSIKRNQEVLYNHSIEITREGFMEKYIVYLKSDEPGIQRFTISLSPVAGEITLENNVQDIFIDLLEGKQKILLLANAPHPDISAIKQAVQSNVNFEITDFLTEDFDQSVTDFDLVILHGLPSVKNSIGFLLEQLQQESIPVFFIITQQTSLHLFNEQKAGLVIQPENILYNEARPRFNQQFSIFTLSDKTILLFESAPPLVSPYTTIRMQALASPLLFQRIGSVNTSDPQLVFFESGDNRYGALLGEGIWRWRIKSFSSFEDHQPFDELINNTVQFLALKADKRFFRVITANSYDETDDVEFEAQLYNEIYELVNDPEVQLLITDQSGNEFPFVFNRTANAYLLNAGKMEPGVYGYEATSRLGDKFFSERGEFTVTRLNIELMNTVADHNLLFNLAASRGGEMIYPQQLTDLGEIIRSRDDVRSITYFQKTFSEVLNNVWLLMALLVIMSAEWFIRKRAGSY
ncbi:MAG: hypothetical protein ACNA7V_08845 [Bacteroidales bacterium]